MGVKLNIGEFAGAPDGGDGESDTDPERLQRLTAHAIARLADRIPLTRKISRHMEGTENKAGIVSDLLAILVELGKRNEDLAAQQAESLYAARAQKNGHVPPFTRTQTTATQEGFTNAA